jgi:hypothetical protein
MIDNDPKDQRKTVFNNAETQNFSFYSKAQQDVV